MVTLNAYAKINLGLRIIGKRNDGYHNIETVFHRVNIFDEITFSPSEKIQLECDRPDLPTGDENLCVRAAQLLQKKYNIGHGVHIQLKKNIPVGAGLGGGSSDAATTLIGLTHLWKLIIEKEKLASFALELGSDVPYFLQPGSARAAGRGELLTSTEIDDPYWILILYPDIHISTAWAFNHWEPSYLKSLIDEHEFNMFRNDFEPFIIQHFPVIGQVKKALCDAGALSAHLSGSGSAVYGIFFDEQKANSAVESLGKDFRVFITPPHFRPNIPLPFGER